MIASRSSASRGTSITLDRLLLLRAARGRAAFLHRLDADATREQAPRIRSSPVPREQKSEKIF